MVTRNLKWVSTKVITITVFLASRLTIYLCRQADQSCRHTLWPWGKSSLPICRINSWIHLQYMFINCPVHCLGLIINELFSVALLLLFSYSRQFPNMHYTSVFISLLVLSHLPGICSLSFSLLSYLPFHTYPLAKETFNSSFQV